MMRVAVAMLLVALSAYPVLAQQPYMKISVYANMIQGSGSCEIGLYVMNHGHVTLDNITLHLSIEDKEGNNLGSITKRFRYVDPGKDVGGDFYRRVRCYKIGTMTVREVTSCRFGGKRYRGCEKLLMERKIKVTNILPNLTQ